MESFLDEQKEQERLARRSERIEQMRREKQLQEKRRQLIKTYWPVGVGSLGLLMLIVVLVVAINGKSAEPNGQQAQNGVATGEQYAAGTGQSGDIGAENGNGQSGSIEAENGVGQSGSIQVGNGNGQNSSEGAESDALTGEGVQQNGGSDITTGYPNASQTTEPAGKPAEGTKHEGALYQFEATADTVNIYSEEVISTHAILIDESTDTIIASKNAYERISPASMTKVLTVLVAAEHVAAENLDDPFTITLEYTDYAYINDCSTAGFLKDEQVTVRDLFYGTILPSGGDAAVALAYYVAGSHEAFVEMMNEKLDELGLSESAHFTNCVGLYDKEHYCTVYDMAVIMKAALQNNFCKEVLAAHTYTTTANALHPEGNLLSNWFLRRIEDKDTGGEVLCAKTGYVDQSQSCAVSYGLFASDTPYICVTVGSSSSWRCIYDHVEIYTRYVPLG